MKKVLIVLIGLSWLSCQKNINSLNNQALLDSKTMLNLNFVQLYDIDTTKTYSSEYLRDMVIQNEKIQNNLYALYDSLLTLQDKIIEEMQRSKKISHKEYTYELSNIKENKRKVKEELSRSKNAQAKIEQYLEDQKKREKK